MNSMLAFQSTIKVQQKLALQQNNTEYNTKRRAFYRYYKGHLLKKRNDKQVINLFLRFAVFGTFLGHGINALFVKPNWIPLITCFGFSTQFAKDVMPIIGIIDILVAVCAIVYPKRVVFLWAFFWAFITALSRPISGEPIVEFIERASNWTVPLVVYILLLEQSKKK